MTENPKKALTNLEARIRQLMFICTTLEEERKLLLDQLDEKDAKIMTLLNEKDQLEAKYLNQKMAHSLSSNSEEGSKESKARFNKLVREIDKCIALLNE